MIEYVARFTELVRFADDYVATDVAKVRRFENGLRLSIRGRIVGLQLQDMDSMVWTTLTIERERWRTHGALRMRVSVARGRKFNLPPVQERGRRLLLLKDFRNKAEVIRAKAKMGHLVKQDRRYIIYADRQDI